jgi:hypothetical protein
MMQRIRFEQSLSRKRLDISDQDSDVNLPSAEEKSELGQRDF